MTTYTATVISDKDRRELNFRSLDALAKRLGGTTWQLVHSETLDPPTRQIEILRRDKYGTHLWRTVSVPSDAIKDHARRAVEEDQS